jgi:hypothetical protein
LVEDVEREVGEFMGWIHHEPARGSVNKVKVTGFPIGTAISYTDIDGTPISTVVDTDSFEFVLDLQDDEDAIRQALETLALTAPLHSDVNFALTLIVTTTGNYEQFYTKYVTVYAVADPPNAAATESLAVSIRLGCLYESLSFTH